MRSDANLVQADTAVVIGAGPAGLAAALALARVGATVVIAAPRPTPDRVAADTRTFAAMGGSVDLLNALGVWSALLRRYPTATVAPFTLLAPIAGVGSAALRLGEPLHWWTIAAGMLVVAGLAINQLSGLRPARRA